MLWVNVNCSRMAWDQHKPQITWFSMEDSIKEKILLLFNPCNLTWSQCKVEQIHTHLAYVGTKTLYYPFHNGLPSHGYCPRIRKWTKYVRVTNIRTKALPESRTGVCYHHKGTYISYHNSVWGTKVKQPQLQGELSGFSYAFSIIISR